MAWRILAWALAAALCWHGAVTAQESGARVEVKGVRDPSPWRRYESQHVIVYTDVQSGQAVELVHNLERLDHLLRLYLRPFLVSRAATPKLTLYFQDRVAWAPGVAASRPPDAIALVNSCPAGVQAFAFNVELISAVPADRLVKGPLNEGLAYLFESYARHFLYRHTDIRTPAFFIDGFAQYFASVRFADERLVVGRVSTAVARYWHHIDYGHMYRMTFDHVLHPLGMPEQHVDAFEFQVRAWNLVHFMLSSEANRAGMVRFLEAVHEGHTPAAAFRSIYGLAGSELRLAMWRYRLQKVQVVQVDAPDLPRARMEVAEIAAPEADFLLAEAALQACPDRAEGLALLERLRARAASFPDLDAAQRSLSRAEIGWGDPRAALRYLQGAIDRGERHPDLHLLLGLAHLALAESSTGAGRTGQLTAARLALGQAAQRQAASPQLAFALYRAGLLEQDAPSDTAVAHAILAWRHGHDVPPYARSAALAYAWLDDAAGAHRALTLLANDRRDPVNADWARQWIARLQQGVGRAELLAAMRDESRRDDGLRQWTMDGHSVARKLIEAAKRGKSAKLLGLASLGNPDPPATVPQAARPEAR
jgi:hypothetical protein